MYKSFEHVIKWIGCTSQQIDFWNIFKNIKIFNFDMIKLRRIMELISKFFSIKAKKI